MANDIAQETFLKIWEKQNTINTKKVKGLLFKIAGDIYISHYREKNVLLNFLKILFLTKHAIRLKNCWHLKK